jgi:hypothetical protein
MRRVHVLILLLLALPAHAGGEASPTFEVVEGVKIEKDRLVTKTWARPIDLVRLAERVDLGSLGDGSVLARARKYLARLPMGRPLSVEVVTEKKGRVVVGLWPVSDRTVPKELALVLKLTGPARIKPAENPKLEIRLVNRSKRSAHRVVLPNDGSESGWREPHVYLTATSGGRAVKGRPIGRCGMFAVDWHRDVVVLAPGQSVDLTSRYLPARMTLALPAKGKVKLVAHYDYGAGKEVNTRSVRGTGSMGKTPAFDLVSKPIEIEMAGP